MILLALRSTLWVWIPLAVTLYILTLFSQSTSSKAIWHASGSTPLRTTTKPPRKLFSSPSTSGWLSNSPWTSTPDTKSTSLTWMANPLSNRLWRQISKYSAPNQIWRSSEAWSAVLRTLDFATHYSQSQSMRVWWRAALYNSKLTQQTWKVSLSQTQAPLAALWP